MNILLIDNYDSFVYNLFHLFAEIDGVNLVVRRNDDDFLPEVERGTYDAVIIGSGPGSPDDDHYFGKCKQIIQEHGAKGLPILGVCLGFQGIAFAFGASLKRAPVPVHGKLSELEISNYDSLFKGVANHIEVMRYHSLMVDAENELPSSLVITAEVTSNSLSVTQNGREIMAIEHKSLPIYGVQFHPESFATEAGLQIAKNFVDIAAKHSRC